MQSIRACSEQDESEDLYLKTFLLLGVVRMFCEEEK